MLHATIEESRSITPSLYIHTLNWILNIVLSLCMITQETKIGSYEGFTHDNNNH